MTLAAGSVNSRTMRAAASRSSRLVKLSSLPWWMVTLPKPVGAVGVPGRGLVRVLAVAQDADAGVRAGDLLRERLAFVGRDARAAIVGHRHVREFGRDHLVVRAGMREGLAREFEAEGLGHGRGAAGKRLQHARVVGRVDEHEHVAEVLGRRAHHARAADVDLLDQPRDGRRRVGRRLRERIEVDDHQIDQRDAVFGQRREVIGLVAPRQDAAVHPRVQRLDAAVEHLGKAGDLGHLRHGEAVGLERLRGTAGGKQLVTEVRQAAREGRQAGLVGHADQGVGRHIVRKWTFTWLDTAEPASLSLPAPDSR